MTRLRSTALNFCNYLNFYVVAFCFSGNFNASEQKVHSSPLHSSGIGSSQPPKQQEPNIDLELDVKVFINSGKCVLHTKDPVREEEMKM